MKINRIKLRQNVPVNGTVVGLGVGGADVVARGVVLLDDVTAGVVSARTIVHVAQQSLLIATF